MKVSLLTVLLAREEKLHVSENPYNLSPSLLNFFHTQKQKFAVSWYWWFPTLVLYNPALTGIPPIY